MDSVSARPSDASDNPVNTQDPDGPWPAEARRLAAQARQQNGTDWVVLPTWLFMHQWLRRSDARVTVLLAAMSTVVTEQGEVVVTERVLADRLVWRINVLERVLADAEDRVPGLLPGGQRHLQSRWTAVLTVVVGLGDQ